MNEFIKQSVGIDISKLSFSACICQQDITGEQKLSKVSEFNNTKSGFNQFIKWQRKLLLSTSEVICVMEATGVYYENLAYHLTNLKMNVAVILPNKVAHFAKSLNIKTKTDAVDARVIAKLGVERKLTLWKPPHPIFKTLKELTRQYSDLKKERTVFINRSKAIESGYDPQRLIIKSNKAVIKEFTKQIEICEIEIGKLIRSEEWLWSKVNKILTIKGVGLITASIILAETQGFEFVQNIKQLTSYAGLDVVKRESGTSIQGKTKISKKGNGRIRSALYFPALISSLHNEDLAKTYHRIIENKPSKMIGITALQRKILILIYTLWKKNEAYIENYPKGQVTKAGRVISSLPAHDSLQLVQLETSFVSEI